MDAVTVEGRAASHLLRHKEELADAVTHALYTEMAELTTRYGSIGREKCTEDLRYTIEHLVPAVGLGQAEMLPARPTRPSRTCVGVSRRWAST